MKMSNLFIKTLGIAVIQKGHSESLLARLCTDIAGSSEHSLNTLASPLDNESSSSYTVSESRRRACVYEGKSLTCNSNRLHAIAIFPECLRVALYDDRDSGNCEIDRIEPKKIDYIDQKRWIEGRFGPIQKGQISITCDSRRGRENGLGGERGFGMTGT
jgi:hypothetical protein